MPQYDDSSWTMVDAPHDMLVNQEYNPAYSKQMGYLPRNSGWYRKHFTLPADWAGMTVWVYIEGAFHTTASYLNGAPLGFHQAGYTSFWLRLDNVTGVRFGAENLLALYVDATYGSGWWYEGGGLIRHNYIVAVERTHLQPDGTWTHAADIRSISSDGATAEGATMVTSAEVTNHGTTAAADVSIRATVTDATGTTVSTTTSGPVTVAAGATTVANTTGDIANVQLWSVLNPYLYNVTVDLLVGGAVADSVHYTVGVRDMQFDTEGLHINGHHVKVRGFCGECHLRCLVGCC